MPDGISLRLMVAPLLPLLLLLTPPAQAPDAAPDDSYETRAAWGSALLNAMQYEDAAASLGEALRLAPPPPLDEHAQRIVADARLGLSRALTKLGRHEGALDQLNALHGAADTLPRHQRLQVQASVQAERAAVLACAGRLAEAVNEKKDALLGMDQVLEAVSADPSVPPDGKQHMEKRFASESAELCRLLMWAGEEEEAAEVGAMAASLGGWKHPQQLPAGQYVRGLAAHAWHEVTSADGKRRLRKSSKTLVRTPLCCLLPPIR